MNLRHLGHVFRSGNIEVNGFEVPKNSKSFRNLRDFAWRHHKAKLWCGKIFRRFEKGYHAIALQMGASHMKDRAFDMYGMSREMFRLQIYCIVTSSIVIDFFSQLARVYTWHVFEFGRIPCYFGIFKHFIALTNRKKELNTISTETTATWCWLIGDRSIRVHWMVHACDPWCCVLTNQNARANCVGYRLSTRFVSVIKSAVRKV